MTSGKPSLVRGDQIRARVDTRDGGFVVEVGVDWASHRSLVLLGSASIRCGTEPVTWQAASDAHEAYYVSEGTIRVEWMSVGAGEAVVHTGEYFYFPPGGTYTVTNVGQDDVSLVWTVSPSPREPGGVPGGARAQLNRNADGE